MFGRSEATLGQRQFGTTITCGQIGELIYLEVVPAIQDPGVAFQDIHLGRQHLGP